jgi:hypothetical protein
MGILKNQIKSLTHTLFYSPHPSFSRSHLFSYLFSYVHAVSPSLFEDTELSVQVVDTQFGHSSVQHKTSEVSSNRGRKRTVLNRANIIMALEGDGCRFKCSEPTVQFYSFFFVLFINNFVHNVAATISYD